MIPKYIHTFVRFWREWKKSIMLEIGLLNLQPFMNNHFHFLITWFSKISSPLMLDSHPLADQCIYHHECPFYYFQTLCTILLKFCTLTIPSPYTSTNWWWFLMRKVCFANRNQLLVRTSSHNQVSSIIPTFHHITWIAPHWLIHVPCYMLPLLQVLASTKKQNALRQKSQVRELCLLNMPHDSL